MFIQTKDLCRSYLTEEVETLAVKKVNLEIEKGEFVAVMGPSGCGKTTLLNLLGLIDRPTAGEYLLNASEINGLVGKSGYTRFGVEMWVSSFRISTWWMN